MRKHVDKVLSTKLERTSAGIIFLVLGYGMLSQAGKDGSDWYFVPGLAFLIWSASLLFKPLRKSQNRALS